MIGIKFILRILLFVFYAGLAFILLALVWYALSRFFRMTWDIIERSNSDFAVWLKQKFRNSETLPWLCRRGLHKWSKWEDNVPIFAGDKMHQSRRCLRCNYVERKIG